MHPNGVEAVAAIICRGGRVLVLNHVKGGWWTLPVGKVDPGESPETALRREMREELGIEITSHRLLRRKWLQYSATSGGFQNFYAVEGWNGELRNMEPAKHRSMEWKSREELYSLPVSLTTAGALMGLA